MACLTLFGTIGLLASGSGDLWSPSAAWVGATKIGDGTDLATLPDSSEMGDDLLLLDPGAAGAWAIEVSSGGSGLAVSGDRWELRRGDEPATMAVGLFTDPNAFGVAVGYEGDGIEVLLVPEASGADSRYTERVWITDVATGFLDGDAVMDVAYGALGFPAVVGTLVIE